MATKTKILKPEKSHQKEIDYKLAMFPILEERVEILEREIKLKNEYITSLQEGLGLEPTYKQSE